MELFQITEYTLITITFYGLLPLIPPLDLDRIIYQAYVMPDIRRPGTISTFVGQMSISEIKAEIAARAVKENKLIAL